eukprot:CAMPEP_0174300242 /NCGR_PEP_ID=MMETSP0809-20121228/58350_1 /TAXON_ID=73025 ORGANISM="Eutreptiella gymnastica-like, Strain CCMP1594" /NCGR_SAMPLE_ID=MMETSP0809 /ASSEMBLY_ACC=CAM_ASM_000658 /LENGTH=532 /DNA_ID=CAMNT_0015405791 /DNA_START=30 /DNA_END=1628 /DNA_ORIENTATION=+
MMLCGCRKSGTRAYNRPQGALVHQLLAEHTLAQLLTGTNVERYFYSSSSSVNSWLLSTYNVDMKKLGGTMAWWEASDMRPSGPNPSLPSGVRYKTPSQLFGSQAALFKTDNGESIAAHFTDVNQGELGNCWLMAAIAAVARYGVAQTLFTAHDSSNVTVTLHKCDGGRGAFNSSFSQTVSTQIPSKNGSRPCYVSSDNTGEYWPCMLEKAVAAAHYRTDNHQNGYAAQAGGIETIGMAQLLGGFPGIAHAANLTGDALYNAWDYLMAQGITVAAGWKTVAGGPTGTNGEPSAAQGLVAGHAYTVIALANVGGIKLALFRNPWGKNVAGCDQPNAYGGGGEWRGKWSDCDANTWNSNPQVKAACGWKGKRHDGCFWMDFNDIGANLSGGSYGFFIPKDPALRAKDLRPVPGVFFGGGTQPAGGGTQPAVTCSFGATKMQPNEKACYKSRQLECRTDGKLYYTNANPDPCAGCTDSPAGWKDSHGYSCEDYKNKHWCNPDGSQGSGWKWYWGSHSKYATNGVAADDACCACGKK